MVPPVRRRIAALVLASLSMLASVVRAQSTAQAATHPPGTVEVRFRVALSDARDSYPVEGFRILILTPRRDSIFARTDVTGGAQLWLEPGAYVITRYQGVEFDGVRWVWELPLAVRPGMGMVNLTARNGLAIGVAAARPGTTPVVVALPKSQVTEPPPTLEERIGRVERGLLPAVVAKGAPIVGMSMRDRMAHYGVRGVSVAVIDGGELQWARGYGITKLGGRPIDAATLFQAASISKPVAAAGALRLVQEGKLALDDPVNARLTSWKVPDSPLTKNSPVTLRELLSHSAGLNVHGFLGYKWTERVPTLRQVLDGAPPANSAPIRVVAEPGTVQSYSGGGFTVMQQLMIDVTGKPFPELMRQLVLDPLGMTHSTYEQPLPRDYTGNAAVGHRSDGTEIDGRWHTYPEDAAAGLWTTPSDLARFAIELQRALHGESNRMLSQAMTREMLTQQKLGWGLGIDVEGDGPNRRFSHGGANEGYRAYLVAFTETGQGAVVMTNSDDGYAITQEIVRGLAHEYHWPTLQPTVRELVAVDPALFSDFVGRYRIADSNGQGAVITLSRDQDHLLVEVPGSKKEELLPASESSYIAMDTGYEFTFRRAEGGDVAEVLIDVPGGTRMHAPRIAP